MCGVGWVWGASWNADFGGDRAMWVECECGGWDWACFDVVGIGMQVWESFVEGEEEANKAAAVGVKAAEAKAVPVSDDDVQGNGRVMRLWYMFWELRGEFELEWVRMFGVDLCCGICGWVQVVVTDVLGGGKLYVQTEEARVSAIQKTLEGLRLKDKQMVQGMFVPQKGDTVTAQFSSDGSWNRALVSVVSGLQKSG